MLNRTDLDLQYEAINREIDANMKAQERLGRTISAFAASNGYESSELDAKFQRLVDDMHVLLKRRHEISDKINALSA